jgi:hypothetical protein
MTKATQRNAISDGQHCLYVAFIAVDPFFMLFEPLDPPSQLYRLKYSRLIQAQTEAWRDIHA